MEKLPLVTVYIPTYNRISLLKRAVESVLNQDYPAIELIVVDDGSSDGTVEYLEYIAKKEHRIRYFVNTANSGACVSRNKAIDAASGFFITGLDDDDYFCSDHISSFISTWDKKPGNVVALYANQIRKINEINLKKAYPKPRFCSFSDLICANWVGNQIFTKTKWLQDSGGFDINFKAWQDIELWYRFLEDKNGIAMSTNKFTYIVDVSHPHERISNKKIELINSAYHLFIKKHKLSNKKSEILSLILVGYGVSSQFSFKKAIRKIFYMPKKQNIRHFLVLFVIKIRSFLKR